VYRAAADIADCLAVFLTVSKVAAVLGGISAPLGSTDALLDEFEQIVRASLASKSERQRKLRLRFSWTLWGVAPRRAPLYVKSTARIWGPSRRCISMVVI